MTPPRFQRLLHDALACVCADADGRARIAVVTEGLPHTYGELQDAALRLAGALRANGVRRGDRVAIYMDNTWPAVVSIHAASLAGAAIMPVNLQTKADKLGFMLADSGARALLTDGHLAGEFVPALRELETAPWVACLGTLAQGVEAAAFDDLLRDTAPLAEATGVLHVRGPHVMAGYWNRPEQTAHMLRPGPLPGERVLCTHDLFRTDDEGFLYFVGRSDDIIKTRGEKVSPVEVENVLHAAPGVLEAAVIGVPDPVLGEAVRAYVVRGGDAPDERQLRAHCAARLENFMVPREIVFCDVLPHTATGKVSKRLLRESVDA
ncbi:MAG: AMP-binding protein [Pseudoxanthomonas sp.]